MKRASFCIAGLIVSLFSCTSHAADGVDYATADPALKIIRIDTGVEESFVPVRVDTAGRLFVGGREGLFVYEPDESGGYRPRRELYRFPAESWIFDIAIRGHDLYVMTASALYLLPGAVTRREGLQPQRLLWGQPRGHIQLGFHALAWGPEGDLYFTMGDALQHYGDFNRPDHWGHWTLFGGSHQVATPYTGAGAVLRCRPDGGGVQVVARGTFNDMALAFDRDWNLFTDDNDREAMPFRYVPARLLHVTPHADFGWPRGWMASKTPERSDLLDTMYGGLGREAPVGLEYYDEALLPPRYRHSLLLARYGQRSVTRHTLRPRGASFTCDEHPLLVGRESARPLGVCVGRGGRIFATIGYMAHLEGSPRYRSDLVMITTAGDESTHPFDGYDAATAPEAKLWAELSQRDAHRRQQAHAELLRRGGPLLREAVSRLAAARHDDPALGHLVWLAAANGSAEAREALVRCAGHSSAALRLQAVRALAEFPQLSAPREVFLRALGDRNPQVQHAAVLAFFRIEGDVPAEVIRGPARSTDTYLRQAATLLLAERTSCESLEKLNQSDDAATRLAVVLAAGFRLTLPPATARMPEHLPLDPYPDAANIIQFADIKLDLRKFGRIGNFTVAEHWKAGSHTEAQERLFALLLRRLDDKDERVRVQAAHFLSLLADARSEPLVAKVIAASEERRLEGAPVTMLRSVRNAWIVGPFPDGDAGLRRVHPPEQGPVELTATYRAGTAQLSWQPAAADGSYFDFTKLVGVGDRASCYACFVLESGTAQSVMFFVGSNDGVKVWHNGRLVWENNVVRRSVPYNDMVMLRLQPGSNHVLIRVHNATGDSGLHVNYKALGPVSSTLPEKLDASLLAQRLKSAADGPQPTQIAGQFLRVNWPQAVAAGNAARGAQLFEKIGCAKCHAARSDQPGSIGPSLADAGRRFTVVQLVQSVLLPSQQVAPVFRQTLITTRDGDSVNGLVVGETGDHVELVQPDATRKTIPKTSITGRRLLELSPMPPGLVTSPDDLRDLLAYLVSGAK